MRRRVHLFRWSDIKRKLGRYVYRAAPEEEGTLAGELEAVEHAHVQQLIDWSWQKGVNYECIVGIIALRLLSYGYSDPFQFNEEEDWDVLDFLDTFNAHTGGWPVFQQLLLVGRKLRDRLADPGSYPRLQERGNLCDILDSNEDREYRDAVLRGLETGKQVPARTHLRALSRGLGCAAGAAVALLSLALDLVRDRGLYQGSQKDGDNLVFSYVFSAQPNWSPFFDLLTTEWPIWELLSHLACVDSSRPCATRSEVRCFASASRQRAACPHDPPVLQRNFAACGEHDICTWPEALGEAAQWCVPFSQRPPSPREPFLLRLGHDDEERVCSQCGQDGVIRALFARVGFREGVGEGGPAPFYVEFGARKPGMLNSAALRQFCGWEGLLMDSQPGETPHGACPGCPGVAELVRVEFVTAENVVSLFHKHGVPRDFDLLTIDVDYND
ncbi:unnamed protein product [Prorocentrum cordatum]|uniref:Uncharacterized protein n=1 Tax=Prorocentrum cordatum TaxID=2364126 RepID=A0ABN9Y520_9DINO|nr:unnamed protein product [Polarella glacialis]